jgi:hypothetical protein
MPFRLSDIRICLCRAHHKDGRMATEGSGVRFENVQSEYLVVQKDMTPGKSPFRQAAAAAFCWRKPWWAYKQSRNVV